MVELQEYDTFFRGLQNMGENNCFLNVVIQTLWHLGSFRSQFLLANVCHRHKNNTFFILEKLPE